MIHWFLDLPSLMNAIHQYMKIYEKWQQLDRPFIEMRLRKYTFWSITKQSASVNCTWWYLIDFAASEENNEAHRTLPLRTLKPTQIALQFCPEFSWCCAEKPLRMRSPKAGRTKMSKHSSSLRHHKSLLLTGGRKQYIYYMACPN